MKFLPLFQLFAIACFTTFTIGGTPVQLEPLCVSPPDDATIELIECYDIACKQYQDAFNDCEDDECRISARNLYFFEVFQCSREKRVAPGEWATIWYFDGEYGVSFDQKAPEGASQFQF